MELPKAAGSGKKKFKNARSNGESKSLPPPEAPDLDSDVTEIEEKPKMKKKVSKGEKVDVDGESTKKPINPAKVKEFLLKHPEFLDGFVASSVGLPRLRDWLNNKWICGSYADAADPCSNADVCHDCPNSSLLRHFKRGQEAYRFIPPRCCTCTQLPVGQKSRRPFIIYALDENDSDGNALQNFTVPRVMTINEMAAFSRRYGFDLCRRMNMY